MFYLDFAFAEVEKQIQEEEDNEAKELEMCKGGKKTFEADVLVFANIEQGLAAVRCLR